VDDLSKHLATRLRRERERRGWSLSLLADRARVSKSMISKVERGEASPTAVLLGRLSGAFGLTMSSLLENRPGPKLHSRRSEQALWKDPATGYVRRTVCAPGSGRIEITEVTLPAGTSVAFPKEAFAFIDQQLLVLKGTLHFIEGKAARVLKRGDHLTLGPARACTFENRLKTACVYLVMLVRSG